MRALEKKIVLKNKILESFCIIKPHEDLIRKFIDYNYGIKN